MHELLHIYFFIWFPVRSYRLFCNSNLRKKKNRQKTFLKETYEEVERTAYAQLVVGTFIVHCLLYYSTRKQ